MTIFQKIGHFFVGLFDSLHKAYLNLSPEEQSALQQGTGLVNFINTMLDKTPADIRAAIKVAYPNLDEASLESALFQAANSFGINAGSNLDEAIAGIQKHLASLNGSAWEIASHAIASALAILFAPGTAKIPVILSLVEWAYQFFHKKSVGTLPSSN